MGRWRCFVRVGALCAAFLFGAAAGAERIDSGYQTIRGTRVFTHLFHERGYARFSNDCGSQTLTQGQLQAGAIPDDIIPCPRSSDGPAASDRVYCSNGRYCDSGNICIDGGTRCLPVNSLRHCGKGRYCNADEACNRNMPEGSSRCFKITSPRYCGDSRLCPNGYFCKDNLCHSTDAPRYCGNGRFCREDEVCNTSMPEGSQRCF